MANLDNVIFALGGNGVYFYNSPKMWLRGGLPAVMEQKFQKDEIADVRFACLGEYPGSEFFFSFIKKEGGQDNCFFQHGNGIPKKLVKYCQDQSGNWDKDKHLRVVLGPNKSFFAWDLGSIRWSNLPPDLEATIQSWLSPMGWTAGPPRIIALGKDGVFFAKSEYGAHHLRLPASWPHMNEIFDQLAKLDMMEDIEVGTYIGVFRRDLLIHQAQNVFLNPGVCDSGVVVMKNTHTYGHNFTNVQGYRQVAHSFAAPEIQKIYEKEWKKSEDEAKKQAEELGRKEMKEKERQEAVLQRHYTKWKKNCDDLMKGTTPISEFPHLPVEICTCEIPHCWSRKVDKLLFACRHDVEKLLRASRQYSYAWLRSERLAWHPDRFGRKCTPETRDQLSKKAAELFSIFEELIAESKPT